MGKKHQHLGCVLTTTLTGLTSGTLFEHHPLMTSETVFSSAIIRFVEPRLAWVSHQPSIHHQWGSAGVYPIAQRVKSGDIPWTSCQAQSELVLSVACLIYIPVTTLHFLDDTTSFSSDLRS